MDNTGSESNLGPNFETGNVSSSLGFTMNPDFYATILTRRRDLVLVLLFSSESPLPQALNCKKGSKWSDVWVETVAVQFCNNNESLYNDKRTILLDRKWNLGELWAL